MAGENAYNLSVTPASNTAIGGNGSTGSDVPSNFDDSLRALASFLPEMLRDLGGANLAGGSANALTITPSGGNINALFNGLLIACEVASDNTSTTVTLNAGGTGAEPVKKAVAGVESDPNIGDLQDGAVAVFRWRSAWDSSNGAWELVNPYHRENHKLINVSIIASSDASWAFDSRTRMAFVEILGGGGGGGGADSTGTTDASSAGGGGSGEYVRFGIDVAALGASPTTAITIGAGGAGKTTTPGTGTTGGTTTYNDGTTTVTAIGGTGGAYVVSTLYVSGGGGTGGTGGTGSGSFSGIDTNRLGGCEGGDSSSVGDSVQSTHVARSGQGGNSPYGAGGRSTYRASASAAQGDGGAGLGYGAGGAGGVSVHDGTMGNGGDGSDGVCIIWEYA